MNLNHWFLSVHKLLGCCENIDIIDYACIVTTKCYLKIQTKTTNEIPNKSFCHSVGKREG